MTENLGSNSKTILEELLLGSQCQTGWWRRVDLKLQQAGDDLTEAPKGGSEMSRKSVSDGSRDTRKVTKAGLC
jgi:hypothetical protein